MKFSYKLMIDISPKYLNKISVDKLSEEVIMYAIDKGFNYKMEIDDRYLIFQNYVLYNLNRYPEYKFYLLEKNYNIFDNAEVKKIYIESINEDVELFLKVIYKYPNFVYEFNSYDKLSDEQKKQLMDTMIKNNFNYNQLPEQLKKDNLELGILFIKNSFENLNDFLKYNQNISNVDEILLLYIENYDTNKKYIDSILELISRSKVNDIKLIKLLIQKLKEQYEKIAQIIYLYPNLMDELSEEYLKNNIVVKIIKKLVDEGRYKITKKTPNYVLDRLFVFNDFIYSLLEKDFLYIYLLDDYFNNCNNSISYDNSKIYDICKKNNYLLRKDSPLILKKNYKLLIDSLNANSIELEDIDLRYFLNRPISDLIKIVDIAIKNNFENNILKEIKDKINKSIYIQKNDKYGVYISKDVNDGKNPDKFIFDVNSLPENVKKIYVSSSSHKLGATELSIDYIVEYDINIINKMIECIKKSGRNIKLVFKLNYEFMDSSFLQNISDLDFIEFTSEKNVTTMSGKDVLKINKTLELLVRDIKESNFSNYEKFLAIYNIVKSFKKYRFYLDKEEEDNIKDQSRSLYLIMQNDYIVCVGYANLLEALLRIVGINSISYSFYEENHQINYVNIVDEKYGINGIIKCDPTNDNRYDDILTKGYENSYLKIGYDLSRQSKTPFDRYLLGESFGDIYIIYKYIIKLDPTLSNLSPNEAIDIFKKKWFRDIQSDIMMSNMLEAIVNIKSFVYDITMEEEEKSNEKMLILMNYHGDLRNSESFSKYLMQHAQDVEKYSKRLSQITLADYLKKNDYVKLCIDSAVCKLIELYNKNCDIVKMNFKSGNLVCIFFNLDNEKRIELSKYLKNLNLELNSTSKENVYCINIKDLVMNMPLQEAIVKLQEIVNYSLEIINKENEVSNKKA